MTTWIGVRRFEALRSGAAALYRELELEADVFEGAAGRSARGSTPRGLGGALPTQEIHRLAERLRRQLGEADIARLASLLQPETRSSL